MFRWLKRNKVNRPQVLEVNADTEYLRYGNEREVFSVLAESVDEASILPGLPKIGEVMFIEYQCTQLRYETVSDGVYRVIADYKKVT